MSYKGIFCFYDKIVTIFEVFRVFISFFMIILQIQVMILKLFTMKKLYILAFSALLSLVGMSQQHVHNEFCAFDRVNKKLMKADPVFEERIKAFDAQLSRMVKSGELRSSYQVDQEVYEIPVVVHVIHDGSAVGSQFNKSDADIQAWINQANQVFEGVAPALSGPEGRPSIPVRLVLAKRDKDCNATTGIVRVNGTSLRGYSQYGVNSSTSNGVDEDDIKALSRWDPAYYYNIYVVNKFDGNDGVLGGLMGYAYLAGAPLSYDGTFMLSEVVRGDDTVLPHEFGHALGLYHPFGDADGYGGECPASTGDCTVDDDMVCDTEATQSLLGTYPCPTSSDLNPCTGAFYKGVQYNIMNYGYCLDRFTEGQADRAVAQLLEFRSNLLASKGGKAPESSDPGSVVSACVPTSIANAGNTYNMGPTNVTFGDINYSSYGYNIDGYKFYWDHTAEMCITENVVAELEAGTPTPLSISVQTNIQDVRAYIDYNNNGVFDVATETVFSQRIPANQSATVNVTPPSGAVKNTPLRMRVIADFQGTTISPCYNPSYGQVEDFVVIIDVSTSGISANSNEENLKVYTKDGFVVVENSVGKINRVTAVDILGRKLFSSEKLSVTKYQIPFSTIGNTQYIILQIETADKQVISRKIAIDQSNAIE